MGCRPGRGRPRRRRGILSFAPAVSRWAFVQRAARASSCSGVQTGRTRRASGAAQVLQSALDARQAVVGGHLAGDVLGEVGKAVEATLAATNDFLGEWPG